MGVHKRGWKLPRLTLTEFVAGKNWSKAQEQYRWTEPVRFEILPLHRTDLGVVSLFGMAAGHGRAFGARQVPGGLSVWRIGLVTRHRVVS